jgi:hypothetical protein
MDSESMATTPGADTTPYIRFAIDQLTRDEEVRGSRMYPQGHDDASHVSDEEPEEETDYPVERIVSDESMGYMKQDARTQDRLSRYMPQRQSRQAPNTQEGAMPEKHPYRERTPEQAHKDVFIAHDVPHAPLDFLPAILRPLWLLSFTFLCMLVLATLIFCAIYSNRQNGIGLWDYRTFGDTRYFIFEYLPTLLGALVLLCNGWVPASSTSALASHWSASAFSSSGSFNGRYPFLHLLSTYDTTLTEQSGDG